MRKTLFFFTILASSIFLNFDASELVTVNGEAVGNNVCANSSYYYTLDSNSMYEADILNSDTGVLQQTINAQNGSFEFVFPANVESLSIYTFEFTDQGKTLVNNFDLTVSDCGYEVITEDYSNPAPKFDVTVDESNITLSESDLEDYKLYINFVEDGDDHKFTRVRFDEGEAIIPIETNTVQFTETYSGDAGKEIENYYEVDISEPTIIRKLSTLELQIIKPLSYIDKMKLIDVLLGLIILFVLMIFFINTSRKYRIEKKHRQKMIALKKKKEQEKIEAERKAQLLRQKKLAEKKAKIEEKKARQNLEVRK